MKNRDETFCPCCSGKLYKECCKPFHEGVAPSTALQLMRSRYTAYALNIPAYIIKTTHPDNPHYNSNKIQWMKEITSFSLNTDFNKLEILDFQEQDLFASVTFTAHLVQNKKEASFKEKSFFEKVNGQWLYQSMEFIPL